MHILSFCLILRRDINAVPLLATSDAHIDPVWRDKYKEKGMEHKKNDLFAQLETKDSDEAPLVAAKGISRGTTRLLRAMGFEVLEEFKLNSRRRADLAGLDRKGRFVIVEIKSSLADFRTDNKWHDYLPHCDFFYFAVADDIPTDVLPKAEGLIIADAFHGAVISTSKERKMDDNRRRTQILDFARMSARRVDHWRDPGVRAFC